MVVLASLVKNLAEGKESARNSGDLGSIPGSGRSPGEGNSNPLRYFHLGNPMDRGAWQATQLMGSESDTMEQHFLLSAGAVGGAAEQTTELREGDSRKGEVVWVGTWRK